MGIGPNPQYNLWFKPYIYLIIKILIFITQKQITTQKASDIENEIGTPDPGTPYVNLDSDARSVISDLEVNINQIGHGSFGRVCNSTYQDEQGKIIEVAVKKLI